MSREGRPPADNPWKPDASGSSSHRGKENPFARPYKGIIGGPPSSIRPFTPAGPSHTTTTAGPSRTTTSIRAARDRVNLPPQRAATPPRAQQRRVSVAGAGYRVPRRVPLTAAALYVDEARPPILAIPKPHHVCSICFELKSHPVSYVCGHSHCFVCIRVWLEKDWKCPDCGQEMHMAPFRHYGEEQSIADDYPFLTDDSRVALSFAGLSFPSPPAPVIILDVEDDP
ncbi:hypothetical protein B0H12DRAFT_1235095 [Mycena haematopus]|nr:hypothetical protein B0H12DRAFT_1235095 [Mycena haematopus]